VAEVVAYPRRVVVVGCPGAGKTQFAAKLARNIGATHVMRDLLGPLTSDAFRAAVYDAITGERWVFDGPPFYVETLVYPAVDTLVWLDYRRSIVMARAIRRAARRTFRPLEDGQGFWSRLHHWVAPGGPRFAWSVYDQRRQEFGKLQGHPVLKEATFVHLTSPVEADAWIAHVNAPA
jgi:hypothetical protein